MNSSLVSRFGGSSFAAIAAAIALAGISAPALAQGSPEPEPVLVDAAPPETGIPAWGITNAELPADPDVVYGVLENGMRYALKRNSQPAGEASIRLLFEVGSRDEADGEEGAAHFVEHMAFNGSAGIPEGELVPMLERLGLAFGADTNAETYPHYTMYKLDLPNLDEETVAASFTILREMSSELTIAPDAVEREKGIMVSEYQVRNSAPQRMLVALFRNVMRDDRLAERAVAEPEALRSLSAETLRGFYEGFYRPDRATLVVVGDVDLTEMQGRIESTFANWQGKGMARDRYVPATADLPAIKTTVFADPALPDLVELQRVVPFTPASNSVAAFRDDLLDQIAALAINNRLADLAREEDARFLGGQVSALPLFTSLKLYSFASVSKEGNWANALAVAAEEWRRAAQFGFTQSEVDQAKANILSNLQTAVEQSNSSSSAGLASDLAISSLENTVLLSPEQQFAVYQVIAGTITPQAVKDNFNAAWGAGANSVLLALKAEPEGAEDAVAAVLDVSSKVELAAPVEAEAKAFAYTDFGAPGTVASDSRIDDLGIRTVTFDNGVQLNLKKTDFEPGSIIVQVEVGTGRSRLTDRAGIQLMAQVLSAADDLGQHSATEIGQVLAGRQVGYGYTIGSEAVTMERATTPADLLLQLQLITAQITDTAFSAQAQRQWESVIPILEANLSSTPQGLFGPGLAAVLTGNDPRFGFTDPAVLGKLSMDDLKAVVGGQFAGGPIELAVVGDFEEDAVIAAVAATLGAIDRPTAPLPLIPPVAFRESRETQILYHKGEAAQGMISLSWPTTDGLDQRSALTRELLADLIRLEALRVLREELGATYTPSAISDASSVFAGFGHITLLAPAEPATMDQVSSVVRELVAGFSTTAPSADAIQRARQPMLEGYQRSESSNASWAGVVVDAQSNPERLEERRQRAAILSTITPEDLQAAAKEFLTGEPVELRIVPPPPVAP
jgi:zinc protease